MALYMTRHSIHFGEKSMSKVEVDNVQSFITIPKFMIRRPLTRLVRALVQKYDNTRIMYLVALLQTITLIRVEEHLL